MKSNVPSGFGGRHLESVRFRYSTVCNLARCMRTTRAASELVWIHLHLDRVIHVYDPLSAKASFLPKIKIRYHHDI